MLTFSAVKLTAVIGLELGIIIAAVIDGAFLMGVAAIIAAVCTGLIGVLQLYNRPDPEATAKLVADAAAKAVADALQERGTE